MSVTTGGYALGRSGAPDDSDATRARAEARGEALARGTVARADAFRRAREEGKVRGRRRGRRQGEEAGRGAGEVAVANSGNGPTVLPLPKLAANLTVVPATDYSERPSSITVGNHSVLERVSWSSWGDDTAAGAGTLLGVKCEPSCAEGPETRESAQLEASKPQFSPDNVRYYSRLRVTPADGEAYTVEVQAW